MTNGFEAPAPAAAAAPALEPQRFTRLLDEAMRLTRANLRRLFPPFAVSLALVAAVQSAVQAWAQGRMTGGRGAPDMADPAQAFGFAIGVLAVALPTILVIVLVASATVVAAVDTVAGRGASAGRSIRFVVRPRMFGTILLLWVSVTAAACCCLAPVFYVGPLLSFTIPAMADEGLAGMAALRRSATLATYNPQRQVSTSSIAKVLALVGVLWISSTLVGMVVSLPIMGIVMGSVLHQIATGGTFQGMTPRLIWMQMPFVVLASAIRAAVYLYGGFALALLFVDARRRREGQDLQAAIAGMAVTPPPPPSIATWPPGGQVPPEGGPQF
jgi:hypothetical protein